MITSCGRRWWRWCRNRLALSARPPSSRCRVEARADSRCCRTAAPRSRRRLRHARPPPTGLPPCPSAPPGRRGAGGRPSRRPARASRATIRADGGRLAAARPAGDDAQTPHHSSRGRPSRFVERPCRRKSRATLPPAPSRPRRGLPRRRGLEGRRPPTARRASIGRDTGPSRPDGAAGRRGRPRRPQPAGWPPGPPTQSPGSGQGRSPRSSSASSSVAVVRTVSRST